MVVARPLEGIKVIDFTSVQSGPACTQLLAWFGADVLKIERPGVGDVTRNQLRDIPNLDALYFITLNSNKKSLTLNTKRPEGNAIMEKLIRRRAGRKLHARCDGRDGDRRVSPESIFKNSTRGSSSARPRASARVSPYADLKVYDNVAQCAGGAPLLGEHTDDVLTQLGYSADQIAKMRRDKVV